MKHGSARPRQLHSGHFAFMRAVVQGVDSVRAWDQYLRMGGETVDERKVKAAIATIRLEFAAAAKRKAKPGTARLVLIDATLLAEDKERPTLGEFARAHGMEDFSESEQAEAYEEAYGKASRRAARRRHLIERQLEALRWLEALVAQDPQPGDSVAAWLSPTLAARLEKAGMPTLFTVVERMNAVGSRWWVSVPGIGAGKAAMISDWLRSHEEVLGIAIGEHATTAHSKLPRSARNAVVPRSTGLVPLEKFVVPQELDGSLGQYRAPSDKCMLTARTDYDAIEAWLKTKRGGRGEDSPTQRSYRKEAERLLLWAVLERGKPVSSLTVEDANAYRDFLAQPPPSWCGARYHQRWSTQWRPLEGPLGKAAMRQALVILRSMYTFLTAQNYVVGNPFAGVTLPRSSSRSVGSRRTLTYTQWDFIASELAKAPESEVASRRARAIRWLYATGMRLSEMVSVSCQDLEQVTYRNANGEMATGWMLSVIGKGEKERSVPIPAELVAELGTSLASAGRPSDPLADANRDVAILARFDPKAPGKVPAWTASGLYKAIHTFMEQCALKLEGEDARQVRSATTHWLRHTHASHALNGREGHLPVPLQVVQSNLGHASIGTTSGYLTGERDARLQAMEGFWGSSKPSNIGPDSRP